MCPDSKLSVELHDIALTARKATFFSAAQSSPLGHGKFLTLFPDTKNAPHPKITTYNNVETFFQYEAGPTTTREPEKFLALSNGHVLLARVHH